MSSKRDPTKSTGLYRRSARVSGRNQGADATACGSANEQPFPSNREETESLVLSEPEKIVNSPLQKQWSEPQPRAPNPEER